MAIFYNEGETKTRPGVYQRYSNVGSSPTPGAQDGICAIPVRASWGPLGKVVRNSYGELTKNYGSGDYDAQRFTVPAAQEMFNGGATTVYTYRMGTGGKKSSLILKSGETDVIKAEAKYPGTFALALSVQPKVGGTTQKEVNIYAEKTLVETFSFDVSETDEPTNLINACKKSKYVNFATIGKATGALDAVPAASGDLTGGEDPSVTNADYSKAFEALESFYYNCISLDVNDDESLSKTLLLQAYLDHAYQSGKLAVAVAGESSDVDFDTRLQHARALNDEKIVYLGAGWRTLTEEKDGVFAICHAAGVIASTPANQSVTHAVIRGATDLLETFTYAQYADAIQAGALLPSMSNDGSIWFDSGVNTLAHPSSTQDEGWKKIRRTKTRFELFDRLDRALQPKVGRINCDTDGVGDVIQTATRVLDAMITEHKLSPGASFQVERYAGDSAWFTITADDIDSLEKIYLHYQFRFSQE